MAGTFVEMKKDTLCLMAKSYSLVGTVFFVLQHSIGSKNSKTTNTFCFV